MRHCAESTADIEFETALDFSVYLFHSGDGTDVVHVRQTAGVFFAPRKRDFELPSEILRVGMPQQKCG